MGIWQQGVALSLAAAFAILRSGDHSNISALPAAVLLQNS